MKNVKKATKKATKKASKAVPKKKAPKKNGPSEPVKMYVEQWIKMGLSREKSEALFNDLVRRLEIFTKSCQEAAEKRGVSLVVHTGFEIKP